MKLDKSKTISKNLPKLIEFSGLKDLMNSIDCPLGLTQNNVVVFNPGYGLHVGRPTLLISTLTGKMYYLVTTFTTKNPICPNTDEKLVDYYTNISNTKSTFMKILPYENELSLLKPHRQFGPLLPLIHRFTAAQLLWPHKFILNDPSIPSDLAHFWINYDLYKQHEFVDKDINYYLQNIRSTKYFQKLHDDITEYDIICYINWLLRNDSGFLEKKFLTLNHDQLGDYSTLNL